MLFINIKNLLIFIRMFHKIRRKNVINIEITYINNLEDI